MTTLPTARDVFPSGTPKAVCEDFNRRRKSIATAIELFRQLGGRITEADVLKISDMEMADAARSAGVRVPSGHETRSMIRAELRSLGGLPPQADTLTSTATPEATAGASLANDLDTEQLKALLSLGVPVVLVPVQAA